MDNTNQNPNPNPTPTQPAAPAIPQIQPQTQAVPTSTPAPTAPAPAANPNQKTILIVEDDPLLVKMYSTKFGKEGFNVLTAQDGEEGLETALNNQADFMILDVMMPKLSGIDLLTKLRSDPKHANTPVIVLTNLTQKEEALKVQNLNVKEYLVKANFTPSEVVAKVKQYLA